MKQRIFIIALSALLSAACDNRTECTNSEVTDTSCVVQYSEASLITYDDSVYAMYMAFAMQESRCHEDAVSPCGKYVGILQLSKIMVREANRVIGDSIYCYDDRWDEGCSYGMFVAVMRHHNPELNIDKAIDIWNKKCPGTYRNSVKLYYHCFLNKLITF